MKRTPLAVLLTLLALVAACTNQRDLLSPSRSDARSATFVSLHPATACYLYDLICAAHYNVQVSAGNGVTCSLRQTGQVYCWGDNTNGMLGAGTSPMSTCVGLDMRSYPCSPRPLAVVGGKIFSSVSVGGDHVCAIESGTALAYCWGSNASGQLGLGAMLSVGSDLVLQPTMPVGPPGESATWLTFNSISAGGSSTCGITTSQQLYCWGAGHGGPSPVLTSVLGTSATYASVSVGQWSTCALDTSGHTCAGTYAPYSVLGQATTATHFCQIFWGQATECWGDNSYGKAGQDTSIRFIPAASPNPIVQPITGVRYGFTAVAAGAFHTCSLYEGLATCWGHNAWNDLGRGGLSVNQTSSPQAVTMPTNTTFTAISVGAGHTCAIDAQGGVWCWGLNNMGQIGIGSSTNPAMPGPGGSFSLGVAIPTHALNP